ncbi:MBL fold metallo-hydrolase [Brevibacillus borstelensis]|uniref:MBL fold metallo-hydrolase n=1 Tax=Brevibacillus borstelensis TaxID=45462 RepID=UPI00203D2945|nr:MBL fold metallo-hydrolase [Brevibacillus borstelensis]MCM3468725.1 MBL fold metallo-hydrolase [Brevibacillus borstelensis]MCM3621765.1 MBL fold metallo-hydrolase [Brevibacillus borstelensis]
MSAGAVNAKQLNEKVEQGVFLLDVRNPDGFADWKIEGKEVRSINIPYFDFLDDNENIYEQLPADEEIVVICAKGGSAKMVADMLDEKGFQASYLEHGMLEWSQFYRPVTVMEDDNLKLIQLNRLAKGCLSYMVISGGEALVVDPSRHIEEYVTLAEQEDVTIKYVLDTHLHADHISGGHKLAKETGAVYYISSSEMQGSELSYEPLEKQGMLEVGRAEVKILAVPTPGHTPGSVSVLVNDRYLLSGDTIFVGGLGRPDLGGKAAEWAQALYDTVFTTIASLGDDVLVLPTHYADTSEIRREGYVGAPLGEIRRNNEVMRTVDRDRFAEKVAHSVGATPPNYEEIVEINRGAASVSLEKAAELEIGPNRCALHHG